VLPQSLRQQLNLLVKLLNSGALDCHLSRGQENGVAELVLKQCSFNRYGGGTAPVTALAVIPFRGMPGSLFAVFTAILVAVFCFAITAGEIAEVVN